MNTKCPKCGYSRKPSDSAPEYECPQCGIVYLKYLKRIEEERQQAERKWKPRISNALRKWMRDGRILGSRWKKEIESFPMERKIWAALITSIVVLLIFWALPPFTENGKLKSRYAEYTRALEKLQFEKAYSILAAETRSIISEKGWRAHWEDTSSFNVSERYRSHSFSPDRSSARVVSVIYLDGKEIRPNFQQWVQEEGRWYRAWHSDHPESVDKVIGKISVLSNEQSTPAIYSLSTSWKTSVEDLGRVRLTPETKIVITNEGEAPITFLNIKVDYFDKSDSVVFSSVERRVVGSSDSPLGPGEKSQLLFMNASAGFVFNSSTAALQGLERSTNRIERRYFFRRSHSGEWLPLPTDKLVTVR